MQLSVAFSLRFGWDSQLNTSEMFWIDISRWMIRSRCRWISVYLPWRTAHAFQPLPFFVAYLALRYVFNPVNCPAVICLPRIDLLSSFGRETSLVKVMGPRSIFPPLFTPSICFLFLLSVATFHYLLRWSFVNSKAGGIDNPSVLLGSKVTCCVCRSRSSKQPSVLNGAIVHLTTYLKNLESSCIR